MCDLGADCGLRDEAGRTPLHVAVQAGELQCIRFLVNRLMPPMPLRLGEGDTCPICESAPVDVTLAPCSHSVCSRCSHRWKRCLVTLESSLCGISCGTRITGRKKKICINGIAIEDGVISCFSSAHKRNKSDDDEDKDNTNNNGNGIVGLVSVNALLNK